MHDDVAKISCSKVGGQKKLNLSNTHHFLAKEEEFESFIMIFFEYYFCLYSLISSIGLFANLLRLSNYSSSFFNYFLNLLSPSSSTLQSKPFFFPEGNPLFIKVRK